MLIRLSWLPHTPAKLVKKAPSTAETPQPTLNRLRAAKWSQNRFAEGSPKEDHLCEKEDHPCENECTMLQTLNASVIDKAR